MPILILGSAAYYSKAFSQNLRDHFELIFVDLRHFIPSYKPPEEELEKVTLETFADDVESVRQLLGLNTFAILGHSSNAQIAIRYAAKFPQNTSHLISVCGVPYAFSEFAEEAEQFWARNASKKERQPFLETLNNLRLCFPQNRSINILH